MLVAERGAVWQSSEASERLPKEPGAYCVQGEGESSAEFASRVRQRLAYVDRSHPPLANLLILGGEDREPAVWAARASMIQAFVSTREGRGSSEVLLAPHPSDRHSMRAIANSVCESVRGTGVDVRALDTVGSWNTAAMQPA
ncbi:MAG: hypothetical protein AAF355_04605 [Myxococcota bacterium]